MQAMIYRAHQLKAITDNQYQYMMRQVSKKGWRTNEPGDTPYYFNENIFQGAIDVLFEADYLNPNTFLQLFKNIQIVRGFQIRQKPSITSLYSTFVIPST